MVDDQENFGGTKLIGENGEQMDPALAGISPPSIPSLRGGETGGDADDDRSGDEGEADVTASGAE